MGWQDTAQICLNGHLINSYYQDSPHNNQKYCDKCGEKTITECPDCGEAIKGKYHYDNIATLSEYEVPSYCHNCGSPYPWTTKKIMAAKEYVDFMEELSSEEKEALKKNIDDIITDSPRTKLASQKVKYYLTKVGKGLATGFKDILIDFASETAKKIIMEA